PGFQEVIMGPSLIQILIVVGIFVLLFMWPSRLPGIGKSIGEAIRGFKKGLSDDEIDVTDSSNDHNRRIEGDPKNEATEKKSRTSSVKKKAKQPVSGSEDSES